MSPNQPIRRPHRPIDPSMIQPRRHVFDVAPPGRTPASSTSRPILTGHTPQVRDPSVSIHGANKMFGQSPPPSQPKAGPASFDIAAPPAAPPRPTTATHRVAPAVAPFHKNIAPQTAPQPSGHPQQHPYAPVPPQQLAPPHIPSPQLSRPVIRQQSPAAMQPPRAPATMSAAYPTPAAHVADDIPTNLGSMHISEDPVLISKHVPKDGSTKWRWIIAILIVLFIMLIVFDILLDADFITLRQVPHTRFF